MRWRITHDHIATTVDDPSMVGYGDGEVRYVSELPYRFKLYDDDGVLYYQGRSDDRDSEAAFDPLDWATPFAGCTYIKYLQDDGSWEVL